MSAATHAEHGHGHGPSVPFEPKRPPITWLGVFSMMITTASAIWIAAYLPKRAPLGVPTGLQIASWVLLAGEVALLAKIRNELSWTSFWGVLKWILLAYLIIGGMLEYVFLYDDVRGSVLVLMTLTLANFIINTTLLLSYGIARYQPLERGSTG